MVYVNVDQIRLGVELRVTACLARCGFMRAMKREAVSIPLATLLFVGESFYGETQLARHLEKALKFDTSNEIHVLVFRSDKLRSQRAPSILSPRRSLPSTYLNEQAGAQMS